MATKANGFEATTGTITTANNADPDAFTVTLGGGGTAAYTTAQYAHTAQSGLLTNTTSGDSVVLTMAGLAASTVTVSCYVRFAAYPSATNDIIKIRNSGGNAMKVQIRTDGKLNATNAAGTVLNTFASAIGTGAWIRIEASVTKGTTTSNGRIQLAYYAADSLTATASYDSGATVNGGTTDLTTTQLGMLVSTVTGAFYLDSFRFAEQSPPMGAWSTDPLAVALTDNAGTTDAGYTLDYGLSLTIDDGSGVVDQLTAEGPPESPPPGGGVGAALDSAVLAGGVVWLYGLQESAGSTTAGDVSGAPGRPMLALSQVGTGGTAEFGSSGIMPEGTALAFTPATTVTDTTDPDTGAATTTTTYGGLVLTSPEPSAYLGTEFAVWCQFAWTGSTGARLLRFGADRPQLSINVDPAWVTATFTTAAGAIRTVSVNAATGDNRPHFVALTASGNTATLYVDTTEQAATTIPADMGRVHGLSIGGSTRPDPHQVAWVGYSNAALTPARFTELATMGTGGSERSDVRVARILRWLGLTAESSLETGLSDVAYQATGGRPALDVVNELNQVEDGVLFPTGDGRLVSHSRAHRYDRDVTATFTAGDVGGDLSVSVDTTRVVNDLQVSRPKGATYRSRNEASITAYGPRTQSLTLYAAGDSDLLLAADWRVRRYGDPSPRVPAITLDLLTNEAVRASALGLEIGDRIQVVSMPTDTTPGGTTVDLWVEGIDEQVSATSWTVTLATSPVFTAAPVAYLDSALLDTAVTTY